MSEFYSQLLVRYARSVLEIVPRHMFMQVGGRVWRKRVGVCVSVCLMIVCVGVCECGCVWGGRVFGVSVCGVVVCVYDNVCV